MIPFCEINEQDVRVARVSVKISTLSFSGTALMVVISRE